MRMRKESASTTKPLNNWACDIMRMRKEIYEFKANKSWGKVRDPNRYWMNRKEKRKFVYL